MHTLFEMTTAASCFSLNLSDFAIFPNVHNAEIWRYLFVKHAEELSEVFWEEMEHFFNSETFRTFIYSSSLL